MRVVLCSMLPGMLLVVTLATPAMAQTTPEPAPNLVKEIEELEDFLQERLDKLE